MSIIADFRSDLAALRARVNRRSLLIMIATVLIAACAFAGFRVYQSATSVRLVAYFANTNGLYPGDSVRMMGVDVGKIDSIEPSGDAMKVDLHVAGGQPVPADASAVIMSPTLVSARFIQLSPGYSGGPKMSDGAQIPLERTAVPVEWDDFREQLQELASALADGENGEQGPLAEFVTSAADSLKGEGRNINETIDRLSNAAATLGDGREDLFATIRNLQVFAGALSASGDQMSQFNRDLADVTSVLTNSQDELSRAVSGVDSVLEKLTEFVGENRDGLASSVSHLSKLTSSLKESQPDIEQLLHVGPNAFVNFYNIYQPAQGTLTGALSPTQFQNPLQFICGAIQAAAQEGAAESARRCAQHLGPVLKNIAFNYPPVGVNPLVGVQARPDQIDYSQDSLKPGRGEKNTSVPGVFAPAGSSEPARRPSASAADGLRGLMSPNPAPRGGR